MKIVLSLALSLGIVFLLNRVIFFEGLPKVNAEKISRTVRTIRDNSIIFKNKLKYNFAKKKVDYDQVLSERPMAIEFQEAPPLPTPTLNPTITLTPTLEAPTSTPTIKPRPTVYEATPTPTEIILSSPKPKTPTLTKKPKPTPTPTKPAQPLPNVPVIDSPLSQPYYDPGKAYQCYTTDRFIEVYANGVNPDSCYGNVKSIIDSNLTSVSILGKSITIHKKAYPAFKAVSDELAKNTVAKNYKINTIGAYVFRCNVNASSGDPYDTCQSGCVLSTHAFGISVDINWDENCNGCSTYTMPMEIVDIFEKYGFRWGGRYKAVFGSTIDAMHFEYMYDLCSDLNN